LAYLSSKLKQVEKLKLYSNELVNKYPNSEYAKKIKKLK